MATVYVRYDNAHHALEIEFPDGSIRKHVTVGLPLLQYGIRAEAVSDDEVAIGWVEMTDVLNANGFWEADGYLAQGCRLVKERTGCREMGTAASAPTRYLDTALEFAKHPTSLV